MLREIRKKIDIKSQILIMYVAVLLTLFMVTFTINSFINEKYMENEIGDVGIQTVNALKGNLGFIFENVTQFSNLIYFDNDVQQALKNTDSMAVNPFIQRDINKSLINMILSGEYISSVFIIDQYNNSYSSSKLGPIVAHPDLIAESNWYQQMKEAEGDGFYIHKSDGVLEFKTRPNKNYLTYVRQIGNDATYEPLAILMLTIDEETIQSYLEEVGSKYNSHFFITDSNGNYIISPKEYKEEYEEYMKGNYIGNKKYDVNHLFGTKMIMVSQDLGIQDWKLVGSFPVTDINITTPYYSKVIIFIMGLNILFIFICSVALTKLIFNPLAKVEKHMKLVQDGVFKEMKVEEGENEINNLKKVFNHMTRSIENLILKVKEEEKIIARSELDLIQAQINPHFLYNTLDAVSALALMEDHENCFKMTQAIGSFYRNSLNSGLDFITIKDEIKCIESYITILNIRYEDKIQVEYRVEEEILQEPILKLILQPIVENAVHHGIKDYGGQGTIIIKVNRDNNYIVFSVKDQGAGITKKRIEDILAGKTKTGKSGFGLYSLSQRISLYYNIENPVTIISEPGKGTEVIVKVKVVKGGVTK